jgi:hypothetical protein
MKFLYTLITAIHATTIYFKANYETIVDGPLYAGNITINYDMERAKCSKVSSGGNSLWSVTLFSTVDGKDQPPIKVFDPRGPKKTILQVPKGSLSIWFSCSSVDGTTFDSAHGKNYQLTVTEMPILQFKKDYTNELLNGPLAPGGSVKIQYDQSRATCSSARLAYGPETKYSVVTYSINGKTPVEKNVLLLNQVFEPVIDNLEKGEISIWFRCTSMRDTTYDSNFSKNFNYTIV